MGEAMAGSGEGGEVVLSVPGSCWELGGGTGGLSLFQVDPLLTCEPPPTAQRGFGTSPLLPSSSVTLTAFT